VRDVLTTVAELAGATLIAVGLALVWAPLAWLFAGVTLLVVGLAVGTPPRPRQ
jgi:putative exporter of polyketide antibiotics